MFWLVLARAYAHLVRWMAKRFDVWLPGLGFLSRRIHREHVIRAGSRRYMFLPRAASMYGALLVGKSMEPETHAFFRHVIPRIEGPLEFVDVGAAVGEMVVDVAGYPNVRRVIAFDPDPDNIAACRASADLNEYDHVVLVQKVVADTVGEIRFLLNARRGTSGHIDSGSDTEAEPLPCTTLDREITGFDVQYLVLVDVEGAELRVLSGARRMIQATRPLIIFEYIGRHRHLDEIRELLGKDYEVYRLRPDGKLDSNFARTWNCVAVHRESAFHAVCRSLTLDTIPGAHTYPA